MIMMMPIMRKEIKQANQIMTKVQVINLQDNRRLTRKKRRLLKERNKERKKKL